MLKFRKEFWKLKKKFANEKEPRHKPIDYTNFFYKQCMAVTDHEKSKMFKQLLKVRIKVHATKSSAIAEHAKNTGNEIEGVLDANGNIEKLGFGVTITEFNKIWKIREKHSFELHKCATNSLKSYLRILKLFLSSHI